MAAGSIVMAWERLLLGLVVMLTAASLASCGQPESRPGLERIVMSGKVFWLEAVTDDASRIKGLGGRDSIPEDGGMIFVFPSVNALEFVMRDCKFDIDIAYLDDAGRVVAMHTMKMEARNPGESDIDYENRLKRYPSRFACRFAVEVRAGTFERIGLKPGDMVQLDAEGLKRRAK